MSRFSLAVLVLVLALGLSSIPVFAKSNTRKVDNVAATRAYLLARHRADLGTRHDQETGEAAVQSLVARVKSECSGVLAHAPDNHARDQIRAEITDDVLLTRERPARAATLAFAKTVQRLRWSNRRLTYYVTHSATEEAAKENVALPDICADAKALAGDGFKAAPTTTKKFLASSLAANSITTIEGESGDLDEIIWRLLKPYERPDEKALIPHTLNPDTLTKSEEEQAVSYLERNIGKPIVEIAHSLGLPE